QENSMFNKIAFNLTGELTTTPYLILGMICNFATREMEWMDGSEITYANYDNDYDVTFDCVSLRWLVFSFPSLNKWQPASSNVLTPWTVLCVAEPSEIEYSAVPTGNDVTTSIDISTSTTSNLLTATNTIEYSTVPAGDDVTTSIDISTSTTSNLLTTTVSV
ncbi:hypothetical protein PFISCL1PPCAC_17747, partial [Pristionchus fissidentatus]